jgi:hypothetical protein
VAGESPGASEPSRTGECGSNWPAAAPRRFWRHGRIPEDAGHQLDQCRSGSCASARARPSPNELSGATDRGAERRERLQAAGLDLALPYLLLAPSVLIVLAVLVYALWDGLRASTKFYRYGKPVRDIGWDNYVRLWADDQFLNALWVTVRFAPAIDGPAAGNRRGCRVGAQAIDILADLLPGPDAHQRVPACGDDRIAARGGAVDVGVPAPRACRS